MPHHWAFWKLARTITFAVKSMQNLRSRHWRQSHRYYSQVQCQLHVTGRDFCDFIVYLLSDLYVERIFPDKEFWQSVIVGFFFTKKTSASPKKTSMSATSAPLSPRKAGNQLMSEAGGGGNCRWCYCRENKTATPIGCDNENCKVHWFHSSCVGIKRIPRGL